MTTAELHNLAGDIDRCGTLVSFDVSVPRYLVHRRTVSEVLLTDWHQLEADRFICAAQWPRSHSFYRPRGGRHDPLLVAETLRQVGILLCHVGYDVPLEQNFLMERLTFTASHDELAVTDGPANVLIEVDVTEIRRRSHGVSGLRVDLTFQHEGRYLGRGSGWVRCVPPAVYQRVRWADRATPLAAVRPTKPLDPAHVGAAHTNDVVLGGASMAGCWPLRIRTDHPVLFEHPLDHVPGMLVFEAFRQAGRAFLEWPDAQPVQCEATFPKFLELDEPSTVNVQATEGVDRGSAVLAMSVTQGSRTAAQGLITMGTAALLG